MLVGFVERRLDRRIPFKVELTIHFERNGQHTAVATATDISAGGIRFFVPWGTEVAQPGEVAEFVFDLPKHGETRLLGEIRHLRYGIDLNQNRIVYYGAKFIDLPIEIWNSLVDLSMVSADERHEPEDVSQQPLKVEQERQDFRVSAIKFPVEIVAPNGERTQGYMEDISFGGLRVNISSAVPLNTEVRLLIKDEDSAIDIKGICIWAEPSADPEQGYKAGYRFIDLSKAQFDQLRAFVFKLAGQAKQ